MNCSCISPKPVQAAEDRYVTIMGVAVWCGGVQFTACERCGLAITSPVALAEVTDDYDTARVLSCPDLAD